MSERVLWVGDMARDNAAVERLDTVVNVVGRHLNPGLMDNAEQRGGQYHQVNFTDIPKMHENIRRIGELSIETNSTLAVVTNDLLLANGAVDALRNAKPDLKVVGPNQWLAQIESDKDKARKWIDAIDPNLNPVRRKAENRKELEEGMDYFKSIGMNVAVKPIGPAGGRGVRVMGKNLDTYKDALDHGNDILNRQNQKGLLLEEAFEGVEFNMQIMTDGRVLIEPPITVDYSYRDDGDIGPPTGGMGSFAFAPGEIPPFMTADDYKQAMDFAKDLLDHVQAEYEAEVGDGQRFSGVLYPNFIMTAKGLKVIEINARPGDPEWMNIEQVIDPSVDMVDVYSRIATGDLRGKDMRFIQQASTVQYFVPPNYAREMGDETLEFYLYEDILAKHDIDVYFSSAERLFNHYKTVGSSRPLAFAAKGDKPWDASAKILKAHEEGGAKILEFRRQVGEEEYIKSLKDPRAA